MTAYGPNKLPKVISVKALERKRVLERIRKQRAQTAKALREKLLHEGNR
jgi:hypothetical protein